MRTRLFLGVVLFCAPLHAPLSVYNEHEVTTDTEKPILPDSAKLHDKIGKKGFYEKKYATIKFTKKQRDEAILSTITMQWKGPRLEASKGETLKGTLFKKPIYPQNAPGDLLPTHEHQVASSTWSEQNQQLIFTVRPPLALEGTTTLFMVLTVNPELEKILSQGSFSLVTSSLPDAFQSTKREPVPSTKNEMPG